MILRYISMWRIACESDYGVITFSISKFGCESVKSIYTFSVSKFGLRKCKEYLHFFSIKIRVAKVCRGFTVFQYQNSGCETVKGLYSFPVSFLINLCCKGFGRVRARFCGQNLAAKQPHLLFDSPLIKGFRQPDGCVCSVFLG